MPLLINSPSMTEVTATTQKSVSVMHITNFEVKIDPNTQAVSVKIRWAAGYMEAGVFYPTARFQKHFQGEAVSQLALGATSGGSLFAEMKSALWQLLVSAGEVPAGVIQ